MHSHERQQKGHYKNYLKGNYNTYFNLSTIYVLFSFILCFFKHPSATIRLEVMLYQNYVKMFSAKLKTT